MRTIFLGALMALLSGVDAGAADVHDCDVAAAHPSDPAKVVDGVSSSEVVTHVAIPACRRAVADHPGVARFHYQLGRAIVYWAGANNADYSEGMRHLEQAAAMEHTQAQFVLGLMYLREGKVCEAEPVTKKAADRGLKSARISYVDHVTAGRWRDCDVSASLFDMQEYLRGAETQVSGYYETMLLENLQRALARLGET
ncbi:MAG: hypothetical protein R3288_06755 [Woeseiaceae bacterium]|nr:hypothetical protein [Woeseiaceae bacterium]